MSEPMGRLRGSNGLWLDSEGPMVDRVLRDVFGMLGADPLP